PITSPTYVVGHLHDGRGGPLAHLDLYRLAGMGAEDPGLLEPFFAPGITVFVEWPEHAAGAWPPARVPRLLRLAHAGGDARRGEVFVAAYRQDRCTLEPTAIAPAQLAERLAVRREGGRTALLAVGDGAVRFRAELERAGVAVPADGSRAHRVSALMVCRL